MHQPDPSAPLPRRPDPSALLLEAVSRRQARQSLLLAQQWVHRRGISDLQRFCERELRQRQGDAASSWLLDLLARDAGEAESTGAGSDQHEEPATAISGEPATGQATAPLTAAEVAAKVAAEPAATPPTFATDLSLSLHSRAEAAVDAAFAALAETFAELNPGAEQPAEAATEPAPAQTPVAEALAPPPEPIPPSAGVWPSASHSALAVASALQAKALASGDGVLQPASELTAEQAIPLESDTPVAPGMLLGRLRERLSPQRLPRLTRLRTVLRDCVEETMALVRGEDELEEEGDESFHLASEANPPAPAWEPPGASVSPTAVQVSPPALAPTPSSSQFLAERSVTPPTVSQDPAARQAPASLIDRAAERASRLRRDLLQRRAGKTTDGPAPAPSSLSELRGWLPQRDDLPRAS